MPHCLEAADSDDVYCLRCDGNSPLPFHAAGEGVCTNDCPQVQANLINPLDPDASSQCGCDFGFVQVASGACCDCSTIDEFCVACDSPTTCTECTVSNAEFTDAGLPVKLEVQPDSMGCVKPTPFCADDFPSEYEDIGGSLECQNCIVGYRLGDDYQCTPCSDTANYGSGCVSCDEN